MGLTCRVAGAARSSCCSAGASASADKGWGTSERMRTGEDEGTGAGGDRGQLSAGKAGHGALGGRCQLPCHPSPPAITPRCSAAALADQPQKQTPAGQEETNRADKGLAMESKHSPSPAAGSNPGLVWGFGERPPQTPLPKSTSRPPPPPAPASFCKASPQDPRHRHRPRARDPTDAPHLRWAKPGAAAGMPGGDGCPRGRGVTAPFGAGPWWPPPSAGAPG